MTEAGTKPLKEPFKKWAFLTRAIRIFHFLLLASGSAFLIGLTYLSLTVANTFETKVDPFLRNANRVALSVGGTSGEVRKIAKEQRKENREINRKVLELLDRGTKLFERAEGTIGRADTAIASIDAMIKHTDKRVNQEVLPEVRAVVVEVRERVEEIGPVLERTEGTLAGLEEIATNPAWEETALEVKKSAVNVTGATKAVKAGSEKLEAAAGDVQVYVHAATRPVSLGRKLFGWVFLHGSQLAQIANGFFGGDVQRVVIVGEETAP